MSTVVGERSVVISGLGQSAIARAQRRSELQLTLDAVFSAVADAGLAMSDIDGLATMPGPGTNYAPGFAGPPIEDIQDALGIQTNWQIGHVLAMWQAVAAVAAGFARHVVVIRTITEGRHLQGKTRVGLGGAWAEAEGPMAYWVPVGAAAPPTWYSLYAQRHMHTYGVTKEQLGGLVTTQRTHAARNPDAIFTAPLTMEEYLAARPVATPFGIYDCDCAVDASTAFVFSAADTVPDLRRPVRLEAVAAAHYGRPNWDQWDDLTTTSAKSCGQRLWSRTDLKPSDVDVALLYDGFSYLTLFWLEGLGFCGPGESGGFVEGGTRITFGGELPLNPWGGQLNAGRVHGGFGHLAETVRQLRGEAGARQIPGAEVAAMSMGTNPVAGCMLVTAL